MKKILIAIFTVLIVTTFSNAQAAEVTVSLNEQFFDTLLDALFKNFDPPEFPLAKNDFKLQIPDSEFQILDAGFQAQSQKDESQNDEIRNPKSKTQNCSETIRLQREINGVRTAVRFRDGKIYAPIAFAGSYNPPLIGCINFEGWAETNIDLEYDKQNQKIIGRIRVLNVQLNGTGGIGSSLITRLVQSSIDKKVNPIEILQADKLSFLIPMQNINGSLQMKSVGVRTALGNGFLNVYVAYQFSKVN